MLFIERTKIVFALMKTYDSKQLGRHLLCFKCLWTSCLSTVLDIYKALFCVYQSYHTDKCEKLNPNTPSQKMKTCRSKSVKLKTSNLSFLAVEPVMALKTFLNLFKLFIVFPG